MTYFIILLSVLYLLFQKYLHLNVPLEKLFNVSFINIFYVVILFSTLILILFNVYHKLKRKQKLPAYLKLISKINLLLIVLSELLRYFHPQKLHGIYFNGYPIDKILIAAFYTIILFALIFQLLIILFTFLGSEYKILRAIVLEGVILTALAAGSFFTVNSYSENSSIYSGEKTYDYTVILGAAVIKKNQPSRILKRRIVKGIDLYRRGLALKIICTGGNAPGEIPEAEAEKNMLIEHEIPERDIILEKKTSTTLEQISFLKKFISPEKRLLIVSDAFHLARINEMCKFVGLRAVPVSTGLKITPKNLFYYKIRESVALLLFWFFGI